MRTKMWIPILVLLLPALAACGAATSPGGGTPYGGQPATATVPPTEQPTQMAPTEQPMQQGATVEIAMKDISFQPSTITIKVGTTVTWTNDDPVAHTVTSGTRGNPSGLFDSGNVGPGQTFSFTFNEPGTYDYYCKIHSGMDGVVVVEK
jgi:plastocyanin